MLLSLWGDDAGMNHIFRRFLGGEEGGSGVHITFLELYSSIVFLAAIYVAGQIAQRVLKMPNLVGEIICGIVLGPEVANFIPEVAAWVILGEIGLVFLVLEAGIDVDLDMLKLIGPRGIIIAFLGSIFPIALGLGLGFAIGLDWRSAIATGAAFGPTSLGIALNVLRSGGVLNTPVGQVIIAAAVIDDMIALVILSQLSALTGDVSVTSVLIPIVSALGYLIIGGYLAVYVLPGLLDKLVLSKLETWNQGRVELCIMLIMLLALMPATYYSKASPLMAAFIAGLTFCSSPSLHHSFVSQFKRLMQWLMRIFFAASIGFQVPVKSFGDGEVIWKGLVLTLALLGKLGAGFLVPNFYSGTAQFRGLHFRDCLITGFSLAAEGEFAFIIAVYAFDEKLIGKTTYSSIVLAVLLSTIIPPFALRYTIHLYNKKAAEKVKELAQEENNNITKDSKFWCLQTQSESKWGLLHNIMNCVFQLELEVIDHRSWHPRGVHTTLVNEMYVRDCKKLASEGEDNDEEKKNDDNILDQRNEEIRTALMECVRQPDDAAKVKVTPWYPGVVTEIVEDEVEENRTSHVVKQRLLQEAEQTLNHRQSLQLHATKSKSVAEILGEQNEETGATTPEETGNTDQFPDPIVRKLSQPMDASTKRVRNRRVRQKMRSTPVFGGSLFGEESNDPARAAVTPPKVNFQVESTPSWKRPLPSRVPGHPVDLVVKGGDTFSIRISDEALQNLKDYGTLGGRRNSGSMLGSIQMSEADAPVVNMLQGYVRNTIATSLTNIAEEHESQHGPPSTDGGDKRE
eukprot:CAMPEP_0178918316 /NCGR_PEP_ID=MMETSP0786-20121207/13764_1 /TAXON_ID=186022 /ORGANISM="Thalassionema frauenfeldii, Strain CCMP 1798" /LENGTH=795 /DNA_ID=CAMNT_0020592023 /DNA_START=236 /DNA_END=2623 /DNA_ORIENTATION=-